MRDRVVSTFATDAQEIVCGRWARRSSCAEELAFGARLADESETTGPPTSHHDAERIFGYSAMVLFGLSSIYGYYVEVQCAGLRRELANRAAHPPSPEAADTRTPPPTSVGGFTFDMTKLQAERACEAKQRAWVLEGTVAVCNPNVSSNVALPIRLEFESDALRKIAVIHDAPSEQLAKDYDGLYEAMRRVYGPPQVDRAQVSAACNDALTECLRRGEKPRGSVWSWPAASIELQPVWQSDRPVLEERYVRREEIVP